MKKQEQSNSLLTVAQLGEIQKHLPFGAQRVLANKHQCSEAFVSKVLKGLRKNDYILADAITMATNEKKKLEKEKRELQKRVAQLSD